MALAADSALTVGGSRVYKSANKLFALAKDAPIGVMIFGNAEYFDVPWETVIKIFRKQADPTNWSAVSDAGGDFYSYLLKPHLRARWVSEEDFVRQFSHWFAGAMLSRLRDRDIAPDDDDAASDVLMYAREARRESGPLTNMEIHPPGKLWSVEAAGRIRPWIDDEAEKALRQYCKHVGCSVDERLLRAIQIAAAGLIFRRFGSENLTGIVIAGFGADQLFPQLVSYNVDGVLNGTLRMWSSTGSDLNKPNAPSAHVLPFAVSDEVFLFMERIDGQYLPILEMLMGRMLEQFAAELIGEVVPQRRRRAAANKAAELIPGRASKAMELFARIRSKSASQPIVSVLRSLPKEELAAVAEALVELTSLQKRVAGQLETVGGAVDVAVISRGDGLIWIKRKHYFDPSRNMDFFMRQLNNSLGRESDG